MRSFHVSLQKFIQYSIGRRSRPSSSCLSAKPNPCHRPFIRVFTFIGPRSHHIWGSSQTPASPKWFNVHWIYITVMFDAAVADLTPAFSLWRCRWCRIKDPIEIYIKNGYMVISGLDRMCCGWTIAITNAIKALSHLRAWRIFISSFFLFSFFFEFSFAKRQRLMLQPLFLCHSRREIHGVVHNIYF